MTLLTGRKAAVIGGSRGIGREVCLELAQAGADVVLSYNRNAQSALDVEKDIAGSGRKGIALQADVSEPEEAIRFILDAAQVMDGLDILVHCAGVFHQAKISDIRDEDWYSMMRTNLDSAFFACRAAMPYMKKSGSNGRIVLFSSQAALAGTAHGCHYGASKAGLLGLTYCLAKELGPYGITVNSILPGRIDTDMLSYAAPEKREEWLKATPLGYLGEPRDVAGIVVFLCSEQARYITGAKINVNGGLLPG